MSVHFNNLPLSVVEFNVCSFLVAKDLVQLKKVNRVMNKIISENRDLNHRIEGLEKRLLVRQQKKEKAKARYMLAVLACRERVALHAEKGW